LVVQFESFVLPLVMMTAVPLGLVGVVVMLFVTRTYFSIQAAIGAIFMIGIAVANGVLLIEFIQHHLSQQKNLEAAIINGACARLRPIVMTSMASVLGLVPMAIGLGHGAEANIPLGRAVIGGQLVATALTLFVVPVLFSLVQRTAPERPPVVSLTPPPMEKSYEN
jgi:multidrug efflux pump subunit AcrB